MIDSEEDRERLIDALKRWNPWWDGAPVRPGIVREGLPDALAWLDRTPILAICGIRQCGKSTLMLQMIEALLREGRARAGEVLLVNLEEPIFLELLERGRETRVLELTFDLYVRTREPASKPWLFLDEIQNIPGWARWVRAAAETGRARFVVSGSSSQLLEPELASVLTGRSITRTLWPLSLSEYMRFRDGRDPRLRPELAHSRLAEYLSRGGMPRAVLEPDESASRDILKQYFREILHRDVVSRHAVRDVRALEEVAHNYLVNTAQLSSFNRVKERLGLAMDQVRAYTSHLVECYLIGLVPRFSYKASERARHPQKVFARDTGLRNAVAFRFSPDLGPLAETAVFNHLSHDPDLGLFYYLDAKTKAECDFVVWRGTRPAAAIQVCFTTGQPLPDREVAGLLAAMKALGLKEGLLLTGAPEAREISIDGGRVREVPLAAWLLEPPGA